MTLDTANAKPSIKHEAIFKGVATNDRPEASDNVYPKGGLPKHDDHPLLSRGYDCFINDIHSSSIDLFQLCPRKYLLSERFHLQPKGEYTESLHVGTVFHLAKKALLDGETYETTARIVAEYATNLMNEALETCDNLGMLPSGEAFTSFQNTLTKDTSLGLALCQFVHENHPWPNPDKWASIATELPIRCKWGNLVSYIRGTLDYIAYDSSKNELWIVDHKTTSFDPVDAASEYKLSIQPAIYRLLLTVAHEYGILKNVPPDAVVAGVAHNCIRKPTIRQKKTETFEEYVTRCGEWLKDNGTNNRPTFVRSWIRFSGPLLSEETYLRLKEGDTANRAFPDLDRFHRNSKACRSYNRLCQYYELCTTNPDLWDSLLEYKYVVKHRDDDQDEQSDLVQVGGYKHA
jgi:hypothetical protein